MNDRCDKGESRPQGFMWGILFFGLDLSRTKNGREAVGKPRQCV